MKNVTSLLQQHRLRLVVIVVLVARAIDGPVAGAVTLVATILWLAIVRHELGALFTTVLDALHSRRKPSSAS